MDRPRNLIISFILVLVLLLTGCSMPEFSSFSFKQGTQSEAQPAADLEPAPFPSVPAHRPANDINGAWNGSMLDASSGISYDAVMQIFQDPGGSEFTGFIQFSDPAGVQPVQSYNIAGTRSGYALQFQDTEGVVITQYFWGTVDGNAISARVSTSCIACDDAYGTIILHR